MKQSVKSVVMLLVVCGVIALSLAVTNYITSPIIAQKESELIKESLLVVMPDGGEFTELDISSAQLPETVTEAYTSSNGGYVFKLEATGYSSGLVILCGVYTDGTVSGATCVSSNETLGYEKTYGNALVGRTYKNIGSVDTVAGATKTTEAYRSAIKDAIVAAEYLETAKGGTE